MPELPEEMRALGDRAIAEMYANPERVLCFDFKLFTAFALCGQLQLALRHPDNKGDSAGVARTFVEMVERSTREEFPALAEAIRMGFEEEFDV